jgi:hypothetical protein
MLIVAQTDLIVNVDHVKDIYLDEGRIYADFIDNSEFMLGEYGNEHRAAEVLEQIAQSYGAVKTFRMPEE